MLQQAVLGGAPMLIVILSGCMAGSPDPTPANGPETPLEAQTHEVSYEQTLEPSGGVCAIVSCFGAGVRLDSEVLDLPYGTLSGFHVSLEWEPSTSLSNELRLQVYHKVREIDGGPVYGQELVYTWGSSPVQAELQDVGLSLNASASLEVIVGVVTSPLVGEATYHATGPQEYRLRFLAEIVPPQPPA